MWTLLAAFVAFLILAGLALIQVAISRAHNDNVLFKHGVGICVSALTWVFGYVLALGEGHLFIGGTGFDYTTLRYDDVLYRWMFAVITCSIVGGALEGRIRDSAYIVFTFVCTLLIHAVPAHWIWTDIGWLRVIGAIDLAGAGSVHVVAGTAALIGSLLLGPRAGRWKLPQGDLVCVPGSRMPSYGAGTLIVWFGWFGLVTAASRFVGGLASAQVGANAAVNVALGGASGGVVAALLTRSFCKRRDWDLGAACNGIMAGLVSVSAGGHVIPPWAAIVSGVVGALVYWSSARLIKYLGIDDATEAVSVHLSAGLWGLMTVGFWADPTLMARATVRDGGDTSQVLSGFVLGGSGVLIGVQVLQFLCVACWAAVLSTLTFLFLDLIGRFKLAPTDSLATHFNAPADAKQNSAKSLNSAASNASKKSAAADKDELSSSYVYEYVDVDSDGNETLVRTRPLKKAAKGDGSDSSSDEYSYSYVYEYQNSDGEVFVKPSRKDGDKKSSSSSSSSASASSSARGSETGEYESSSSESGSNEEEESSSSEEEEEEEEESSGSGSGSGEAEESTDETDETDETEETTEETEETSDETTEETSEESESSEKPKKKGSKKK